jgi:uroporphyrinogen III methyltransferase / synthase
MTLAGKTVLVTRPREQAGGLADRLERLGGNALCLPMLAIGPPADWGPVDQALGRLTHYDWLVFTSSNGVRAFFTRLRDRSQDLADLASLKIAAIGPATAAALRAYNRQADLIPASNSSEGLAEALLPFVEGKRVLLARADRGREVLRNELSRAACLDEIAVYSQSEARPDPQILEALREGRVDFVTVTSSNIARYLARLLPSETGSFISSGKLQFVSISPITSAALRAAGLPVAAEASTCTMEGLVESLLGLVSNQSRSIRASQER